MAISSQHKGKRAELIVFGELLRKGAELYTPVVDIGVDALVRGQDGTYIELQVKATEAEEQDRYFNFAWEPRQGRFFICVSLKDEPPSVWVIPWDVFDKVSVLRTLRLSPPSIHHSRRTTESARSGPQDGYLDEHLTGHSDH